LVWAIKKDKDKAVCSFGDSGGQGVTEVNGQPKLLGPESVFWSFVKLPGQVDSAVFNNSTDPSANLESMKRAFPDFDWNGTSAACGFNWMAQKSTETFNVVPDSIYIPGESNQAIDRQVYQTELQFANPNIPRTVVNGTVLVSFLDKGGGDDENATIAVNNPLISVDPEDGSIFIGYYDATQPGQINVLNAPSSDLTFYQSNPDTTLNTTVNTGPISYPSNLAAESVKTIGVTLGNGVIAGEQIDPQSLAGLPQYGLQIVDNQINFMPVSEPNPTNSNS
jgi:hypothetical protein